MSVGRAMPALGVFSYSINCFMLPGHVPFSSGSAFPCYFKVIPVLGNTSTCTVLQSVVSSRQVHCAVTVKGAQVLSAATVENTVQSVRRMWDS